jgi:DNA-binding IclR family transcriptional regulator
VLAQVPDGLCLAQILAKSGHSKTTAFRVLASLRDVEFVFQGPRNRRFLLGQRLADVDCVTARARHGYGAIDARMGQDRIIGVLVPALKQAAARLAGQMDDLQQD